MHALDGHPLFEPLFIQFCNQSHGPSLNSLSRSLLIANLDWVPKLVNSSTVPRKGIDGLLIICCGKKEAVRLKARKREYAAPPRVTVALLIGG
jgi:hypothetical protein